MPPGSEIFVDKVLGNIPSQYLFVIGCMIIAIMYLVKQLGNERKAHAEISDTLVSMVKESTAASVSTNAALSGLKSLVERMAYERVSRNG